MNIGIDLGWTVKGVRALGDRDIIAPLSFEVISRLVKRGDTIFIISKVNSEQRERAQKWLKKVKFFEKTGVKPENLYYCFEKRDKAMFVKSLKINVMIDDRAEVMLHLPKKVRKLLICPERDELREFGKGIPNMKIVNEWFYIAKELSLV